MSTKHIVFYYLYKGTFRGTFKGMSRDISRCTVYVVHCVRYTRVHCTDDIKINYQPYSGKRKPNNTKVYIYIMFNLMHGIFSDENIIVNGFPGSRGAMVVYLKI